MKTGNLRLHDLVSLELRVRNVLNATAMFCTLDKDMTSKNRFRWNYFQVTVRKLVSNLIVPIWEDCRFYSTKVMLHIVLQ